MVCGAGLNLDVADTCATDEPPKSKQGTNQQEMTRRRGIYVPARKAHLLQAPAMPAGAGSTVERMRRLQVHVHMDFVVHAWGFTFRDKMHAVGQDATARPFKPEQLAGGKQGIIPEQHENKSETAPGKQPGASNLPTTKRQARGKLPKNEQGANQQGASNKLIAKGKDRYRFWSKISSRMSGLKLQMP
jgi:hypothetical protein